MSERGMRYGPLEQVDGRWVMGDTQTGDAWLEFRTDGLYQHVRGWEGQLIPWPRIMGANIKIGGSLSRARVTPTGLLCGLPGPWRGHGGGRLDLTLRNPYGPYPARFERHPSWYRLVEVDLACMLVSETMEAGEGSRLGDPEWLSRAVGVLATRRRRRPREIRRVLAAARQV
ncbi:hypothetical protein [Embleya sp. AB8]|uniref:hypothetical protein n=1 Tax=Embleya sp. AB8 TaxID=3156304 RepID=UPI003C747B90